MLDIDGVINTTAPWKADELAADGYSKFNKQAIANLNYITCAVEAELWISSSRRTTKPIGELQEIFKDRGIEKQINGYLPTVDVRTRCELVMNFIRERGIMNFLIIDDDQSLQDLPASAQNFWIAALPMKGLTKEQALAAIEKTKEWL